MLNITDDDAHGCFLIEPTGKLTQEDFNVLTGRFNAKVNDTDRIPNLVIHATAFPGWKDFAGLFSHLSFLRDHHKIVAKIALVSDSRILDVAPGLAQHFLFAEIRHFPDADLEAALGWVAEPVETSEHVTFLPDLPPDVVGISVRGVISAKDYQDKIVPLVESRLKDHAKLKLLYQLGPEFEAMTPGAVWSDARVGLMNLSHFTKIAVVSDIGWIRHATRAFSPLIPGRVHVFGNEEFDTARDWVVSDD